MSPALRTGLGLAATAALSRPFFSAATKAAVAGAGAFSTSAAIYGLTALVTLALIGAQGRLGEIPAAWRRCPRLLAGVLLAGLAANIPVVIGLQSGDVSTREVLARTDLLFALIIGRFAFGERIRPLAGAGLVLMLAGTFLETGWHGLGGLADPAHLASHGWFLLSALGIAAMTTLAKGLLLRGVGPDVIFLYNMGSVTAASAALAALPGDGGLARGSQAAWVLAAGALHFLALEFTYRGLRYLPVWLSRATALLSPLAALALGALTGEALGPAKLAGVALVLGGAGLIIAAVAPAQAEPAAAD